MPDVVVLVLVWNGSAFLQACLSALCAQQYNGRYAVLVVDNASTDNSIDIITSEFPQVVIIRNDYNRGFAGGNNIGLRALLAGNIPTIDFLPDTIVLLNQDTVVAADWLAQMMDACERNPQAGIVGCKMLYSDGTTIQHAGGSIIWPLATGTHRGVGEQDIGQYDIEETTEFVTGAAMAIQRSVFESIGLLDEGFTPAYYEDTDFCFRARRAGFDIIYAPSAHLIHYEGTALQLQSPAHQRAYHRNRVRFLLKYGIVAMVTNEFLQAEQEEIGRWSLADSVARKQAYIAGRIALPDILSLRQDINSNTYEQLSNVLQLLHQAVVEEESSRRRADLGIQVLKSSQAVSPILAEPFADLRQHHESTSLSELRAESAVSDNSLTSKEYSMEASEQIPEDTIDIAEIMRQVRMRIAERQDHASARDLPQVLEYANQQWDKVYEPLQLPRLRSPLGRVWDIARLRFHNEVRSYLDPMMFRQTEFNSSVVRALNMLFRRGQSVVSAHEIEALRDEIIRLRTQVQRLEEKLGKE